MHGGGFRPQREEAVLGRGFVILVTAVAALWASGAPAAGEKKLVCWTDDSGAEVCSDWVPPRYSKGERRVVDPHGRTLKTLPREATAEEITERRRRAQAEAEAQSAASAKAASDRVLLESYRDVPGLLRARDERLAALDARAGTTEKAMVEGNAVLAELRSRTIAPDDAADAGAKLQQQIRSFETAHVKNAEALAALAGEREKVCASFTRDLVRMQEIAPGVANPNGACPARTVPTALNP